MKNKDHSDSICAVAFIDIVGWKAALKSIGHEGLLKVAMNIAEHKAQFSPEKKEKLYAWEKARGTELLSSYYQVNFAFMSDSFVVSAPADNLLELLNVIKWDCMHLLADHGFLTRGGISIGNFMHDMQNDITLGLPLNQAVDLEKNTKMPRIQLGEDVIKLANHLSHPGLVYNDGEHEVLNIANRSKDWLHLAMNKINQALSSNLSHYRKCKWHYVKEHLPKMSEQVV